MYSRSGFGDLPAALNFTKPAGGDTSVFKVGESWTITVTGPAGQPVYLNANGLGAQLMGTTDSSGRWTLTGTMGEGEKGAWLEQWYIGGTLAGGTVFQGTELAVLHFQVVDAPAPPPMTVNTQQTGGPDPHPATGPGAPPSSSGIPTWMLVAAGALALFVFAGGRR